MRYRDNNKIQGILEILKALLPVIIMCLTGWALSGCVDDQEDPVKVDHVLLVYLGGDNNLSGEAGQKLTAIARGYEGGACRRMLVYQDAKNEGARLIEITDKNRIETLETYEAENSASQETFSRVIRQAAERYPGAGFNLLVFSHASGWLPQGSYSNPALRSIVTDGKREMELSDFAKAIPEGMFNYIVFEACHMAGIEVAYELKDKAGYIIGSSAEIVSPGFTDSYETSVNDLVEGDPERFILAVFKTTTTYGGTFSIIETGKLDALADFVKANCDFSNPVPLNGLQYFDRGSGYLFADFEDYYSRLLHTDAQKDKLTALIKSCVAWKAATPSFMLTASGFMIDKHSGLTGYVMPQGYPKLNAAYRELSWYHAIH